MIAQLAAEIQRAESGDVEVVVSDNRSRDRTADLLDHAARRHAWLTVVRPARHFYSGEENFYFALQHARGEYVWGFGDDDEIVDGALSRILRFLRSRRPDFAIYNVSAMREDGVLTHSRYVEMDAPELWWPIDRIVAGVGLMGLSACLSAMVARRERLLQADWETHLARSSIYAHVISYIEAFHGARSVLIDEVTVVARQGATGSREFSRLTTAAGKALSWPWAVGLPRHLDHLIQIGVAPTDFASQICERCEPRGRLLPSIIQMMARQMREWLEERRDNFRLLADDLFTLMRVSAAALPAERECAHRLLELWGPVASLVGDPDAPNGGAALDTLPGASTAVLEQLLSFGPQAVKDSHGLAFAAFFQSFEAGGRNASQLQTAQLPTLAALIAALPREWRDEMEAVILSHLRKRLDEIDRRLTYDLVPDWQALTPDVNGMFCMPLGGLYVALPVGRPLTHDEREDLNLVDMRGVGEVVVAETWNALERKLADRHGQAASVAREDEQFAGWSLGALRRRQLALKTDSLGETHVVRSAGDRISLRKAVLIARRKLELFEGAGSTSSELLRVASKDARQVIVQNRSFFDPVWYTHANPVVLDAIEAGIVSDELQHWLEVGGRYGLDPMVWFDSDDYFAHNPDALGAVEQRRYPSAMHHYIAEGARAGAVPFYPFDPAFYLDAYADAREAHERGVTPLKHFLDVGLAEGRKISRRFDEAAYLQANPDVAHAAPPGDTSFGLHHYRANGRAEGRPLGLTLVNT